VCIWWNTLEDNEDERKQRPASCETQRLAKYGDTCDGNHGSPLGVPTTNYVSGQTAPESAVSEPDTPSKFQPPELQNEAAVKVINDLDLVDLLILTDALIFDGTKNGSAVLVVMQEDDCLHRWRGPTGR